MRKTMRAVIIREAPDTGDSFLHPCDIDRRPRRDARREDARGEIAERMRAGSAGGSLNYLPFGRAP